MPLRDPKEITVTDGDGAERHFIISKMPAVEGLEIMARWPTSLAMSAVPKVGDWPTVEGLHLKIMKYVAVVINGNEQPLVTQALIDNHAGDWECFSKLLYAEVEYNNRFFRNGTISSFFGGIAQQWKAKTIEILTQLSAQSSQPEKPPSTSSEASTR